MNNLEFSFELSPWEAFLQTKQAGDRISAANFLTLLEGEEEQFVEDALQDLETACMKLDIGDLPKTGGTGEAALRLRQEIQLAAEGLTAEKLDANDPLRLYLEEVALTPACGDDQSLAQQAASGDEKAMQNLTNLGLSRVIELAQKYVGYGVLLLDLIQEGSLGLWKAIGCYHGGDYAAHRDRWIHFYLAKAVTLQARANGVGQKMRAALEDYRAVDERLLSDLGRNATIEEIALEMHMSVEEAASVKKMLDNARLMQQAKPGEEEPEEDQEEEQAVENTALFQMRQRISDLLSALSQEDAKLLTMRFGLEGGLPLSPEDTGKRLGLTAQEVVAREAAALSKLREKT